MKTYEVVGYALDGDVYCPDCIEDEEREEASPVFAGDEWEFPPPCCGNCGEVIECSLIENPDDERSHEQMLDALSDALEVLQRKTFFYRQLEEDTDIPQLIADLVEAIEEAYNDLTRYND